MGLFNAHRATVLTFSPTAPQWSNLRTAHIYQIVGDD